MSKRSEKLEKKTIGELQMEYLNNLSKCGGLTIGRAIYRVSVFNEAVAMLRLQLKAF